MNELKLHELYTFFMKFNLLDIIELSSMAKDQTKNNTLKLDSSIWSIRLWKQKAFLAFFKEKKKFLSLVCKKKSNRKSLPKIYFF